LGKYTATITDNAGCVIVQAFEVRNEELKVSIETNKKTVNAATGEATALNAKVTGGKEDLIYTWVGVESTKEKVFVAPAVTTKYEVRVTDASGCSASSAVTIDVVNKAMAVADQVQKSHVSVEKVRVTPNPSNGNFSVILTDFQTGKVDVKVLDISGKEIALKTINANAYQVTVPFSIKVARGVYIVNVLSKDKSYKEKIVIE
jgi:hypothetical protein